MLRACDYRQRGSRGGCTNEGIERRFGGCNREQFSKWHWWHRARRRIGRLAQRQSRRSRCQSWELESEYLSTPHDVPSKLDCILNSSRSQIARRERESFFISIYNVNPYRRWFLSAWTRRVRWPAAGAVRARAWLGDELRFAVGLLERGPGRIPAVVQGIYSMIVWLPFFWGRVLLHLHD